ncbi:hypothetical protein BJ6T_85370 [Bradyrhizobium japonicum USDA 6]|nr:hypothetical protein BJ6T_85370 [Bradyrhizobium japonicum USDA 6]
MGGRKREVRSEVHLRSPASPGGSDVGKPVDMPPSGVVHIVDDDRAVRESLGDLLESLHYKVALYGSASDFLKVELSDAPACLVLDVRLPGTSGLELQEYLTKINVGIPVILMTAFGDIPMSVRGMKLGRSIFSPSRYGIRIFSMRSLPRSERTSIGATTTRTLRSCRRGSHS